MSFLTSKFYELPTTSNSLVSLDGAQCDSEKTSVAMKFLSVAVGLRSAYKQPIASGCIVKPVHDMTAVIRSAFERLTDHERVHVLEMLTGTRAGSTDQRLYSLLESLVEEFRDGFVGDWWRQKKFEEFIVLTAEELVQRFWQDEKDSGYSSLEVADQSSLVCSVLSTNQKDASKYIPYVVVVIFIFHR